MRDPGGLAVVVDVHVVVAMGIYDDGFRLRWYDGRGNRGQRYGGRQKNFLHEYPQFGTNAA